MFISICLLLGIHVYNINCIIELIALVLHWFGGSYLRILILYLNIFIVVVMLVFSGSLVVASGKIMGVL